MEFSKCPACEQSIPKHMRDQHLKTEHLGWQGANRRACEITLAELERGGRLEPIDEAKVQMVRGLADQLDVDPTNAQMWRTYAEAWTPLLEDDERSDDFEDLKTQINSRAEVGDTPKT